jgi:hypothetical protein
VVAQWIDEGRIPYIFFHTNDDDAAPELGRLFHRNLSERVEVGQLSEFHQNQLSLPFCA